MSYIKLVKNVVGGSILALVFSLNVNAAEKVNVGICVSWPGYAMLKIAEEAGLSPDLEYNFTLFEDPIGGHLATAAGQIDVYMLFGGINDEKLQEIFKNADLDIEFDIFKKLYKDATKLKYIFFYVDASNCNYRRNFNEKYILE